MIRLAWERLKHRKKTYFTIIVALVSIYILVPYGLSQSKTVTTTIHKSIEEQGRGRYDILVRPRSSRTQIEQTLGIVEENYIGDSGGGISIKEWRSLEEDPNIEIAAPVASIGYFKGNQTTIELPILDKPTRYTYQFYTSDGKRMYPLGSEKFFVYFKQIQPGFIQYFTDANTGNISFAMLFYMPENFNLLVAIDPSSEERLTGIDFSDLDKEEDSEILKDVLNNLGNPPIVKVLQRKDLNISLIMDLKVEQLDVSLRDYLHFLNLEDNEFLLSVESQEKFMDAIKKLKGERSIKSNTFEINLSDYQQPFNGSAIKLTKDFRPVISDQRFSYSIDTSNYYVSSKINYENLDTMPSIRIEKPGTPPSYKEIVQKGVSVDEYYAGKANKVPFLIEQVGTFEPSNTQAQLVGSPLGIYGEMEATTEDGSILTPTTIPGSFIPSPAAGVTTLESAELIKGEKPIDAIRIRVTGIDSYNEEGRKKIEEVATKLLKKGYEVDVVAGSSFKKMTLNVEDIGKVNELWTTLGIAQELEKTWDVMNIVTVTLLILFGFLWLFIRFNLEKQILGQENGLLSIIGWSKQKIFFRNSMEQILIITIAFLISLFFLLFLGFGSLSFVWTIILWIFSILVSIIMLNKKEKGRKRVNAYKLFPSILYYKRILIPIMLVIVLSILLISIQIATLGDAYQQSNETTLGQFINEQTYYFQIIVAVFIVYLSIVAFLESLNTLFAERKQEFEMYHSIGWTNKDVFRHIYKESSVWFLLSCLVGVTTSFIILKLQNISSFWIITGLTFSIVMITSIFILTLFIRRSVKSF